MNKFVSTFTVLLLFAFASCRSVESRDVELGEVESTSLPATFITVEEAGEIAQQFYTANLPVEGLRSTGESPTFRSDDFFLREGLRSSGESLKYGSLPTFYVYDLPESGFVIISADQATKPIIGYSFEDSFETKEMPPHVKSFLSTYASQVHYVRENGLAPSEEVKELRSTLRAAGTQYREKEVGPLLGNRRWNQDAPWNLLFRQFVPGQPIGCVTTALSQILHYWKYPEYSEGTIAHTWNSSRLTRVLTADFNRRIEWEQMPENPDRGNWAVARFCYDVAVGLKSEYSPLGTAAHSYNIIPFLQKYYKYGDTIEAHSFGGNIETDKESLERWKKLLRDDLDLKRPILYVGTSRTLGPHAIVCDGYRTYNGPYKGEYSFHFNIGWGGSGNGWYTVNIADPRKNEETLGNVYGFSGAPSAITGIYPPKMVEGEVSNTLVNERTLKVNYPEAKSLNKDLLAIFKTTFAGETTVSGTSYYSDFVWKRIKVGSASPISYEVLLQSLYPMTRETFFRLWVDWDRDGSFSDVEMMADKKANGGETSTFRGAFSVPSGQKVGGYRLRIATALDTAPRSSGDIEYGEVEDYTLVVDR